MNKYNERGDGGYRERETDRQRETKRETQGVFWLVSKGVQLFCDFVGKTGNESCLFSFAERRERDRGMESGR